MATYNIDCDLKSGYLDLAIKPRHIKDLHAELEMLDRHQFAHEYRMVSREETQDLTGTDAYIGAMLNMGNGHLHPLNLCAGEAAAAVSLGATIYEQSAVLNIERGTRARVVAEQGSVSADFVVLAGNAYHFIEPKLRGLLNSIAIKKIKEAHMKPGIHCLGQVIDRASHHSSQFWQG
ncbi:FAD-binding oxidoreductase [Porticoccaceae bacterium]|nr:FAD-binding oxidoreductase [Porticoccaceae bacterium]